MELQEFATELEDWNAVRADIAFTGLLVGNGASRAVWPAFAYDSLFDKAQSIRNRPLGLSELAVFKALDTCNFEQVLSALKHTIRVNAALALNSSSPRNRYFAIKEALIHAVRSVHIPWKFVEPRSLARINSELACYSTLYSTNYDLLNYWAIMQAPQPFTDLFCNDEATFDLGHTETQGTRILYLHGGLHLVKNVDGGTRKLLSSESTLLGSFAINTLGDVPLFVNEGRAEDKLKAIRNSDYLSYCYGQLSKHQGALCVFGHDLGEQDRHIVQALHDARIDTLAISIHPRSKAFIQHQKRRLAELFDGREVTLRFFDAKSHPLGDPELRVTPEE
ncbi:DUF4917 family protein [Pseudomonas agarici]|uniref:DUF4917 family protein n=1 Tax=Pseudomonas agarici TaxID=46677 RepID=UPI000306624B|nr:DUF4917 family protein [Pseudomonas agarici]NWB92202.1 DUF4917 family protein [Pseudomonas agarici]NWC07448.1 DUF4917 family protein [Pseudomonas agarici]SEK43819.1 protein of unknown function [Pseudomonas agarici]